MKAVAPKTSPVRPPNFCFDMLPIRKITTNINRTPNKIPTRGKKSKLEKTMILLLKLVLKYLHFQ